jgi:hypothetical protein
MAAARLFVVFGAKGARGDAGDVIVESRWTSIFPRCRVDTRRDRERASTLA